MGCIRRRRQLPANEAKGSFHSRVEQIRDDIAQRIKRKGQMFMLQAPSPQKDPKEEPALGVVSAIMSLFGLAAQLCVGWVDDHRITLHAVGHLTLLLVPIWLATIVITLMALITDRDHRGWALLSLVLAVICIAFLLFWHYPW